MSDCPPGCSVNFNIPCMFMLRIIGVVFVKLLAQALQRLNRANVSFISGEALKLYRNIARQYAYLYQRINQVRVLRGRTRNCGRTEWGELEIGVELEIEVELERGELNRANSAGAEPACAMISARSSFKLLLLSDDECFCFQKTKY